MLFDISPLLSESFDKQNNTKFTLFKKTDCNLLFDKPLMFIPIQRVVISKFLKAILNALQDMSGALTIREGKAM